MDAIQAVANGIGVIAVSSGVAAILWLVAVRLLFADHEPLDDWWTGPWGEGQ